MARRIIATKDNTITSQGTEPLSREVARPIFGESVLAIDYNFAEKDYLDDDIDFSRSSGATQTNSEGKVAFAPSNIIGFSEDFSGTGAWSINAASITSDASTAPFVGNNADLFKPTSNNSNSVVYKTVTTEQQGAPYITSIYAKAAGKNFLVIRDVNDSNSTPHAWFDLSTGTVGEVKHNGKATIESVGNSWYRCSIKGIASSSNVHGVFLVCDANDSFAVTTNGDDGILLFGAQIEKSFADAPSTYIKTISASKEQAPRFDYDKDGNSKGLLIEEARTNLDANSFAVGTLNQSTSFAASNEIDPSGGTSSYKVVPDTSSGFHYKYRTYTVTDATVYTYSVYVKPDGIYKHLLLNAPSGNAAGNAGPIFNLETGQQESFLTADHPTTVTECGNGWYRISVQYTTIGTLLRIDHNILPTTATSSYSGDGSSGMLFWGSQLEAGSFATSLIPTYGATADRSADIASVTGTNFSRFFKDTEGTFVVDAQMQRGFVSGNQSLFTVSDSSASDHIRMYLSTSEKPVASVRTLNSGEASVSTNVDVSSGEIFTSSFGYKTNNTRAFTDNETSNLDTDVDLPTNIIELTIGHRYNNLKQLNGWIRRLRYFNKRKSDSQLQKLTSQDKLLQRFKGAKAAHSLRSLRDGRDSSPVTRIRREYDSYEADYTAAQVSNGELENDFKSEKQTTLPLDVSVEADEMIVGGDFTELVTNGDFATNSGWTTSNATINTTSQKAELDSSSSNSSILQNLLVQGRTYTLTFTVDSYVANGGSANVFNHNGNLIKSITGNGTFTVTFTHSIANGNMSFFAQNGVVYNVSNVSVVEGGWTLQTNWSFGSGTLNRAAGAASFANVSSTGVIVGRTYDINFDIVNYTTGTNFLSFGGDYLTKSQTANGSYSYRITATSTQNLQFYSVTDAVFSIDNVSVKEVNPIATGFSTRKINSDYTGKAMRCRNQGNVEVEVGFDSNNEISLSSPVTNTSQNLLPFSEDFGEWTVGNSVERIGNLADPFGGQNAWSIKAPSSGSYHQINTFGFGTLSITANSTHTFSYFIKKETSKTNFSGLAIALSGGTDKFCYVIVDEVNGTAVFDASASSSNTPHISVTEPVTGWYRVAVTLKDTHSNDEVLIRLYAGFSSNGTGISAVAGSARTIFGAQLEETQYESTPSGSELITNGDFDTDSDWTKGTGWTIGSGVATHASGTSSGLDQAFTFQSGKTYDITFDVISCSGGSGSVQARGNGSTVAQTIGSSNIGSNTFTYTDQTNHNTLRFDAGSGTTMVIDNVSVKEISPVLQTYAQTPVISDTINNTTATTLGEFSGKENLLPYSEDFSQSAWNKQNSTVTLEPSISSPTGGAVYSLKENSANSTHKIGELVSATSGTDYNWSIYIKPNGRTNVKFVVGDAAFGTDVGYDFVLTGDGSVGSVYNVPTDFSITPFDNGWYRIHVAKIASSTTPNGGFSLFLQSSAGTNSYTGDGSSGVYISSAQLNTNSLKDYQKTTGTALTGDVHVVNWYDQGGGEDATQSTAGNQPRIVKGSELVTDSGGKAALDFDADHDNLYINQLAGHQRLDAYYVVNPNVTKYSLASSYNSPTAYFLIVENGSSVASKNNSGDPNYFVNGNSESGTRDDFHDVLEGDNKVVGVTNIDTSAWVNFQVGEYWTTSAASFSFGGTISEMLFFPNMDTSPKRFNIEQNMLNHFDVNLVTNGTFDTDLSNWTNSGSHWQVSNGQAYFPTSSSHLPLSQTLNVQSGKYLKISFDLTIQQGTANVSYTNSSGSSVQTQYTQSGSYTITTEAVGLNTAIHFSRYGGITTQFYLDNVKVQEYGTDGFVTTLYDQTGNNCHALQATAAYQPKLVNGGDLIKSGNHPAWEYPTGNPQRNLNIQGLGGLSTLDAFFVQDIDTAETTYTYPTAPNSDLHKGFVVQSGSASSAMQYNYGSAVLEVNGTEQSPSSRGDLHGMLDGRILAYHRSGSTTGWDSVNVGHSQAGSNQTTNIENGKFSEMIWYDSDQHSNQSGIESNINTHYNIY